MPTGGRTTVRLRWERCGERRRKSRREEEGDGGSLLLAVEEKRTTFDALHNLQVSTRSPLRCTPPQPSLSVHLHDPSLARPGALHIETASSRPLNAAGSEWNVQR